MIERKDTMGLLANYRDNEKTLAFNMDAAYIVATDIVGENESSLFEGSDRLKDYTAKLALIDAINNLTDAVKELKIS